MLENCEQTLPAGFDLARVTTNAIVLAWTRSCEYSNHTKLRIECKGIAILIRLRTMT